MARPFPEGVFMKIITLTRPAVYQCEGVTLIPGENRVSSEDIERLTRNPLVMRDINIGILQIGHGSGEPAPVVEVVAPSDDLEALRALAAGDGRRKDVQEARAKIAELEAEE